VLLAAALAGFIDAVVGGGGLVQLPALFTAFPTAVPASLLGTNKLASILGTASALGRYGRSVRLPWAALAPGAALAFIAAGIGASLATRLAPTSFRIAVPIALTAVLAYVIRRARLGAVHAPAAMDGARRTAALSAITAIGFYDGCFGPGTGSFLMLVFMRLYGFDYLHASASAKLVNVATNAAALLSFAIGAQVHWGFGLALGACNVAGSVLGAHTALTRGIGFVRTLFIGVVAALIGKTGWDAFMLVRAGTANF
jgi:uncharacterized membrane protein YfcA